MARICDSRATTDAAPAPPSADPSLVAATSVMVAWLLFWNGAASCVACMDAELAGRNPLVVSLATDDSEGKAFTEKTVMTIQPTRMAQRKRTEKWPRPVKNRVIGWYPCRPIAGCQPGRPERPRL